MAALEPDLRGAERVRHVFDRVRNGDSRVADLYAEDGVVLAGDLRVVGREDIRAFYLQAIDSIRPQPTVRVLMESSPYYVALVDVLTTNGTVHALDLFQLGEDGIRQLEIYNRVIMD
jgi:hypothetical protein